MPHQRPARCVRRLIIPSQESSKREAGATRVSRSDMTSPQLTRASRRATAAASSVVVVFPLVADGDDDDVAWAFDFEQRDVA